MGRLSRLIRKMEERMGWESSDSLSSEKKSPQERIPSANRDHHGSKFDSNANTAAKGSHHDPVRSDKKSSQSHSDSPKGRITNADRAHHDSKHESVTNKPAPETSHDRMRSDSQGRPSRHTPQLPQGRIPSADHASEHSNRDSITKNAPSPHHARSTNHSDQDRNLSQTKQRAQSTERKPIRNTPFSAEQLRGVHKEKSSELTADEILNQVQSDSAPPYKQVQQRPETDHHKAHSTQKPSQLQKIPETKPQLQKNPESIHKIQAYHDKLDARTLPPRLHTPRSRDWGKIVGLLIAYGIPLLLLLYVLYWNFLPFGYEKTYILDVGAPGDTDCTKPVCLVESDALGPPMIDENGTTYREVSGIVELKFTPEVPLKNATVSVSVEGENVSIIPPRLDFDVDSLEWDFVLDFTDPNYSQNADGTWPVSYINYSKFPGRTPENTYLVGDAQLRDCGMYFNGSTSLYLPNSHDEFEEGPFMVYAEWEILSSNPNRQQIAGHFNWELLQLSQDVSFQVGKTVGDGSGIFSNVLKQVNNLDWHLSIYDSNRNMMMSYGPSVHAATKIGGTQISRSYGKFNFSMGKSWHGNTEYLHGCVKKFYFLKEPWVNYVGRTTATKEGISDNIYLFGGSVLDYLSFEVNK